MYRLWQIAERHLVRVTARSVKSNIDKAGFFCFRRPYILETNPSNVMSVTRHSVHSSSCSLTWGDILEWSHSDATSVTRSSYPLSRSSVMPLFTLVWSVVLMAVEGLYKRENKIALAPCNSGYTCTWINYWLPSYRELSSACSFQGRNRLSAMSVEGVLLGLLTSKFTCQCTARINHTSVASARRCSLALAHWRNTSEPIQVCKSPLIYISSFPPYHPLLFHSFSSFGPLPFLVALNRGRETRSWLC